MFLASSQIDRLDVLRHEALGRLLGPTILFLAISFMLFIFIAGSVDDGEARITALLCILFIFTVSTLVFLIHQQTTFESKLLSISEKNSLQYYNFDNFRTVVTVVMAACIVFAIASVFLIIFSVIEEEAGFVVFGFVILVIAVFMIFLSIQAGESIDKVRIIMDTVQK